MNDSQLWTNKKTNHSNELCWTDKNILYTQQYLNIFSTLSADDILFMDESSVHVNSSVRMYGSSQKGKCALPVSKHHQGCNYTLHLIAGLHGKMYFDISGLSTSVNFIGFIHNATNAILLDGRYVIQNGKYVILDSVPIHRRYAQNIVELYLKNLGVSYTFLPRYSCDLNPVESVFMKLKTILKGREYTQLLVYDVLIAIMHAMEEIRTSDMFQFFKNVINNYMNFLLIGSLTIVYNMQM